MSERHVVVVERRDALAAHRLEERRALERFRRLELLGVGRRDKTAAGCPVEYRDALTEHLRRLRILARSPVEVLGEQRIDRVWQSLVRIEHLAHLQEGVALG